MLKNFYCILHMESTMKFPKQHRNLPKSTMDWKNIDRKRIKICDAASERDNIGIPIKKARKRTWTIDENGDSVN